jgi:hypothetical protein
MLIVYLLEVNHTRNGILALLKVTHYFNGVQNLCKIRGKQP